MGFNATLITFSPNTLMKSADVNSNFTALNGVTQFTGTITVNASVTGKFHLASGSSISWSSSGTCSAISKFTGTGNGLFNHGLGMTPSIVAVNYSGNFGTAPTQIIAYWGATSTQVNVKGQTSYAWTALAYAN